MKNIQSWVGHELINFLKERGTTPGMMEPGSKFFGLLDNGLLLPIAHFWQIQVLIPVKWSSFYRLVFLFLLSKQTTI